MRLATAENGTRDGELLVVSRDGTRALSAMPRCPNLLAAITDWQQAEGKLRELAARIDRGAGDMLAGPPLAGAVFHILRPFPRLPHLRQTYAPIQRS